MFHRYDIGTAMTADETLAQAKQNLVDEFAFLGEWMQRYEYIIELGRNLPGLAEEKKVDSHLVQGCQSRVWFYARRDGNRLYFDADSEALIVRGLVALLLRIYSGRTADEIIDTPPDFFEVLELGSHLSGSRANGLHAMVQRIRAYAEAFRSAPEAFEDDPPCSRG
jgi:cysteine desulfuration protein SufE